MTGASIYRPPSPCDATLAESHAAAKSELATSGAQRIAVSFETGRRDHAGHR